MCIRACDCDDRAAPGILVSGSLPALLRGPKQVVPDDVHDSGAPVAPGDLLALRICAAVVGDRDLVYDAWALRNFCGDLGLESESVALDHEVLERAALERLVA